MRKSSFAAILAAAALATSIPAFAGAPVRGEDARPSPATQPAAPALQVSGEITGVDGVGKTLSVRADGAVRLFHVGDSTKILDHGKAIPLVGLRTRERVTVSYHESDDALVADEIVTV